MTSKCSKLSAADNPCYMTLIGRYYVITRQCFVHTLQEMFLIWCENVFHNLSSGNLKAAFCQFGNR